MAATPFPAACSISLGTAKKSPGGGAFFSITYTKPDRSGVLRAALERPDGSRTSLVTVPVQRVFDDRGESGKGTAEIKIPADAEPGSSWSVLAFVASNSPTCSASFTVA